jgi:hypothetical protein
MLELQEIEHRLRAALEMENLHEAANLVVRYRGCFDQVWANLPHDERESSVLPQEAARLMTWALSVAGATRASCSAQRRTASTVQPYQRRSLRRTRTWHVAG